MEKTKDKGDFSQGSIISNMVRLALPIILAELVQVTYNIVDRMYLGHIPGCGTEALTGIGLVLPFITVFSAFANLFSYGGSTLAAIARGENNDEKARKITENAFTMLIVTGAVLIAFFYIFSKKLLILMGADNSSLVYATDYFNIYLIGGIFVLISLGMNSYINMQGHSLVGMGTVAIGAVFNIVLDPLFIFVFDMGIKGAAIATVISQAASALWVVIFLTGKKAEIRIKRLSLDKKTVLEIIKLGVGGFCFKATNSITQTVCNVTLATFGGLYTTLYIASMSLINSIREVMFLPVDAFAQGAKPVISYNYGARELKRVDKSIKILCLILFIGNFIIWACVESFPGVFIKVFTNDQQLINMCIPCLRTYMCMYFIMFLQSTGQNVFVALKHPGYTAFFAIFRKLVLILPLTIILPRVGLGVNGVFWAEAISEVVGGLVCFTTMYFKVWRPLKKEIGFC